MFDRFRSLPIARIAPLAGPMMADLARYAIAAGVTLIVGVVMGYRPGGGVPGVVAGVVLAVITGWSLAWIFLWIGTRARRAGAVQGMSMMIMFPLAFLSNACVPVDTLPGWLQVVNAVNPVSHVVSAMRDLMNGGALTAQVGGRFWAAPRSPPSLFPLQFARTPGGFDQPGIVSALGHSPMPPCTSHGDEVVRENRPTVVKKLSQSSDS